MFVVCDEKKKGKRQKKKVTKRWDEKHKREHPYVVPLAPRRRTHGSPRMLCIMRRCSVSPVHQRRFPEVVAPEGVDAVSWTMSTLVLRRFRTFAPSHTLTANNPMAHNHTHARCLCLPFILQHIRSFKNEMKKNTFLFCSRVNTKLQTSFMNTSQLHHSSDTFPSFFISSYSSFCITM